MMDAATSGHQCSMHPTILRLEAAAEQHDVRCGGRVVRWRRFGDGPPLVLVHGGHGSWLHWVSNIDALAIEHSVWVPDLPGFGDSEKLAVPDDSSERLQRLVAATVETLDALVGPKTAIDLVGFSFGGLVAAHLAARRGHVRRVAFIGPAGHGGRRRQQRALIDWRLPDREAARRALEHNLSAFMLHNAPHPNALAMSVYEASCRKTRFRSKQISRTADLKQVLARLSQQLLFIWGEHDVTAVPQDVALELTEPYPNRAWCVVPGAGHWVQYERADEVNRLLATWFAVVPGAGTRCAPILQSLSAEG
jgi:pimeloyl-ACP methyl ester carboxylesterase